MTLSVELPTAADTAAFGRLLGRQLRAGDLVILSGSLGAGKTALTKGIGAGLAVRGVITSPTFVIARQHQSTTADGPNLVHVDAYRLAGPWELDDLDIGADLARSVVVVEWGEDHADQLSDEYVLIHLLRRLDDSRLAQVEAVGDRFAAVIAVLREFSAPSLFASSQQRPD